MPQLAVVQSFCLALLGQVGLQASLAPGFIVLPGFFQDTEASGLRADIFVPDEWL